MWNSAKSYLMVSAVGVLMLSGCTMDYVAVKGSTVRPVYAAKTFCSEYRCDNTGRSAGKTNINFDLASDIQWFVQRSTVWTKEKVNRWDDYSDQLLQNSGYVLKDDCDTIAITKASIAYKKFNVSSSVINIHLVDTDGGSRGNHVVATVGPWVLDNRHKTPYHVGDVGYKWISHANYQDMSLWYDTVLSPASEVYASAAQPRHMTEILKPAS